MEAASRPANPPSAKEEGATLTLVRPTLAGADRWLPARGGPFLAVVLGTAVAFWVAGLLLAADKGVFFASREWLVQPLFLAAHLLLLRMFTAVYSENFVAGCAHLDVQASATKRHLKTTLGVFAVLAAAAIAAPLVWLDVRWMFGDAYLGAEAGMGVGGALGAADWLMAAAWAVEWFVTAYLWVLIAVFLVRTMVVLGAHRFEDPVYKVLREKQYRPFLLMSAQGASLVAGFAVASVLYVWIAGGATSDWAGLWITGGLVLVGFVPPWLRLKARLGAAVDEEASRLGEHLERESDRLPADGPRRHTIEDVGARVDVALSILRLEHLRRLHEGLGKVEAQALVLRLLAPAVTVGWRFLRPF